MQAKIRWWRMAVVLAVGVTVGGCGPKPGVEPPAAKPFAAAELKLWAADETVAAAFAPRLKAWGHRNSTAAAVRFVPDEADADVLLVPPARLGRLDPSAGLRTVPSEITTGNAYKWSGLLSVYDTRLAHWGGAKVAVPLVGEGYVLLYRADVLTDSGFVAAFREQHARSPLPARTWDDLIDLGRFATARTGKPALPPVPADPAAAAAAFGHIAACYDRAAVFSTNLADRTQAADPYSRGLSFYLDLELLRDRNPDKWEVRVERPAFREAFNWIEKTAKFRPPARGDPTAAVVSGSAVAAVVPVGDLARLPKDPSGVVDARFGVGPVPGSGGYFDADGRLKKTNSVNLVPHYAGGGLVGVVRASAAHPEAAWSLLAELGGPTGSAASLDDPALGGGPLRTEHTAVNPRLWQQYGFDPPRTVELNQAMRAFAASNVMNLALDLRTPEVEAVNALLAGQVAKVAAGEQTAEAGHQEAVKEWRALDARTPPADRVTARRKSVGLD